MSKYSKKGSEVEQTDIDRAVDEGLRRFRERVIAAYIDAGSVSRAARHLLMSEDDVAEIVKGVKGVSE